MTSIELDSMRIDKWLWVARFFRSRSLAKDAVEGGKVHCLGQRVKVSKEVKIGMELTIRQGLEVRTVIVQGFAATRGPAGEAQQLYVETEESLKLREQMAQARKDASLSMPSHRPSKKERRDIVRFQRKQPISE